MPNNYKFIYELESHQGYHFIPGNLIITIKNIDHLRF